MNGLKGSTETPVCDSETNLNDVRFLRILENAQNLTNALRNFNDIGRNKFGELVGANPLDECGGTKEDQDPSWVAKVLHQQNLAYDELVEIHRWLDSV